MALSALATGALTVLVGLLLRARPGEAGRPAVVRLTAAVPAQPAVPAPVAAPVHPVAVPVERALAQPPPRPRPPRLRPPPPRMNVVDFPSLVRSHPQAAMALGRTASEHREQNRPAIMKCAEALAARRPTAVVDGELLGSVGFVLKIDAGRMRLADVIPHKDSDARFARCFAEALNWARQDLEVPGALDATVAVEWPYTLTVQE